MEVLLRQLMTINVIYGSHCILEFFFPNTNNCLLAIHKAPTTN